MALTTASLARRHMRICKVYDDDYPWDIRVEKVGRALTGAGHEVVLVVRNRQRNQVLAEEVDTLQVRRMPRIDVLPERIDVPLMFPAFFSPRWLAHIAGVVRREACDAILVRDLPLALAGIAIGRALRKPVVVDVAENYPAALRAFQAHGDVAPLDRLVRNPRLADLVELATVRHADHLVVVCEEMLEKLVGKGARRERITIVGNTPDLSVFEPAEPPPALRERYARRFVLLYVGEVALYRGLDTVVDALAALRERLPDVMLVIVGGGSAVDELSARAAALGVADHLDMVGFLPHAELPGYMARGDICLIPHHRNEHTDTTLPNKLFDHMAMGRVTVATDAVPLKRVLRDADCGRVYRSGDAADLARVVFELADPALRRRLGRNGLKAARSRYHWRHDAEALVGVFDRLSGSSAPTPT